MQFRSPSGRKGLEVLGTSWFRVSQHSGDPAGGAKEEQAIPETTLSVPREPQVLQDNLTLSLAEVLQVSLSVPSNKAPPAPPSGVQIKLG